MEDKELWYYLCSEEVVSAFPDLQRSKPFKSGYKHNDSNYYVIATEDPDALMEYWQTCVNTEENQESYNDFWFRLICHSWVEDAERGYLTRCREIGILCAIELLWGLTTEKNVALCIHKLAEYYYVNPIEFVNKVNWKRKKKFDNSK